jgi:hypothetical protein
MEENAMPRKQKVYDPDDPQAILARLALEERAEKLAERDNQKRSRAEALRQHNITEAQAALNRAAFQRICDHLLGNHKVGVTPRYRFCALHKDTFSDRSVRIYCGKCRFEWHPGDKRAKIFRVDGSGPVELPNPTGQNWSDINKFFYSFENSNDLTSRAFRIERVEPEYVEEEEDQPVAV